MYASLLCLLVTSSTYTVEADSSHYIVGDDTEPSQLKSYCPSASDIVGSDGSTGLTIVDQGWTEDGANGISIPASFNLLGGSIQFDMDISKSKLGVNNNLYGIFPSYNGTYSGTTDYCDGQGTSDDGTGTFCPEIDIIENNGPVAFQTTIHDVPAGSAGCNNWGCTYIGFYDPPYWYGDACDANETQNTTIGNQTQIDSTNPFTVLTEFSKDGDMTVTLSQGEVEVVISQRAGDLVQSRLGYDGSPYTSQTSDRAVIRQMMKERGMIISSSQWTGWEPVSWVCPDSATSADSSTFSISNLVVVGQVVQGDVTECSATQLAEVEKIVKKPSPRRASKASRKPKGFLAANIETEDASALQLPANIEL